MQHSQPEGYLALPSSGMGEGVLVLHAWWGLNNTIKKFCDRLAQNGYIAFAPDLYHGKVADSIPGAEALARALDNNHLQAEADVTAAALFLNERVGPSERGLAVIGFSLGAYYAVNLSLSLPEKIRSVVLFYGTGPGDFEKSQAAYLGHFAEDDPYEPRDYAEEMEQALNRHGRPVTFYIYPGTHHWFFEPERETYHPAAANLAWERTIAFLKRPSLELNDI
jgi:carboxymethylenebutenolidase